MNDFKIHIYLFIIPGIIGNVAHMFVVKKDLLSFLAKPVSTALFGKNKTFRGFIFLPVAIGTVCLLNSFLLGPFSTDYLSDFLIGVGLGLAYMLAELPNSFIKRKRGIAPGESSSKFSFIQLIIQNKCPFISTEHKISQFRNKFQFSWYFVFLMSNGVTHKNGAVVKNWNKIYSLNNYVRKWRSLNQELSMLGREGTLGCLLH